MTMGFPDANGRSSNSWSKGWSKEIADRLALSYHTVDNHLRSIYKLQVHTRGAVAKALSEHLVPRHAP